MAERNAAPAPPLFNVYILFGPFPRGGGLLPRFRRHAEGQPVFWTSGAYSGLCDTAYEQMGNQPVFQHHCRSVPACRAGICRGGAWRSGLRSRGNNRRAYDTGARASYNQFHARYNIRRHELRHNPHCAGTALRAWHCAWHGRGMAPDRRDIRRNGQRRLGAVPRMGAGNNDSRGMHGLCYSFQRA